MSLRLLSLALGALILLGGVRGATAGGAPAGVSFGAFVPGADSHPSLVDAYGALVGRRPGTVLSYKSWSQAPFVRRQLDGIRGQGALPMVTWEPRTSSGRGLSLAAIAAGGRDRYVRAAARAAKAWGHPLMVRFAQEMNGSWFPWSGRPAAYKAAWRHLVMVFRRVGADNVRWVWTPYVDSGRSPFAAYFPGDRWVDWVGLDGINWGGRFPWRSFGQIFGRSYRELSRLSSKPMLIAETGSGERGGSKAHWLSAMLERQLPLMPRIRTVMFWDVDDSRGDIRVSSSTAALQALRRALHRR